MHLLDTWPYAWNKMRAICKVVYYFPAHTWCVHQTHNSSLPYFGIFQPSKTKAPLGHPKKEFCHYMPYAEARSSQYDDSIMAFLTKALHMVRSKHAFFFNTNWCPKSPYWVLFVHYLLLSFTQFCSSILCSPINWKLSLQQILELQYLDGGGLMFSVTKLKLIKPNKKFLKNIGNRMNTYFA